LAEICSEGRGLFFELALHVVVRREALNGGIQYIACLHVGR
jgi:hypothetical protein